LPYQDDEFYNTLVGIFNELVKNTLTPSSIAITSGTQIVGTFEFEHTDGVQESLNVVTAKPYIAAGEQSVEIKNAGLPSNGISVKRKQDLVGTPLTPIGQENYSIVVDGFGVYVNPNLELQS